MTNGERFLSGVCIVLAITAGFCAYQTRPTSKHAEVYANSTIFPVFIRGERWGIEIGSDDAMLDVLGAYAITDCKSERIHIHGSLTMANQRDTILHELLHAGTCDTDGNPHNTFYNSMTEEDHEGIYKIADYMSTLLHDNPELSSYLAGR